MPPLIRTRRDLLVAPAAFAAAAFTTRAEAARRAEAILIEKAARRMTLLSGGAALARYRVALGFDPVGNKERAGDGRTPEGLYRIDFKNARSRFHLSLRISYPDAQDRARARAAGRDPGGDIFIHGTPGRDRPYRPDERIADWTLGCIAIANSEIEEVWAMVAVGAAVEIRP